MKKLAIFIWLVSQAAVVRADEPAKQTLTFESAIQLALGRNPDIAAAKQALDSSEAKSAAARANRWIQLNVNEAIDEYKDPYILAFGALGSFELHKRFTTATVVQLSQPLTGLAYLSELVDASEHQTNATMHDYDRTRLDTAYRTADSYIRLLEARANADVAHKSVDDIQSELDRAKQLRAADTYTDIDVLRFQSAKAAADQIALKADSGIQSALGGLVVQIGLPDGAPVEISDDLPTSPPALAVSLDTAQHRALQARPELASAREQIAAAEANATAAWERYVPDVRGVAQWNHLTGVQPFEPEDEYFIGLTATWNVWNWGSTQDQYNSAKADQARAQTASFALVDQVKLDVRDHWLDAKTAYDSLAVAQTQQQTAEEALRLQKVRFDNAAATTTDVLDAQTDAARARLAFATARYDYYRALVALARSVGDLPSATPK
ncbi:MAG TPA: TolC family protein [Kofleriaceae bacterium]|jgi:outer membrane protein TolC|nr:TolC family protein [Kofleriaceae bacterium]